MIKNVVIVSDFAYVEGGAAWVAIETAIRLKHSGLNVIFLCGKRSISQELIENNIEIRCLDELSIAEIPLSKGILENVWNKRVYKKLRESLGDLDPAESVIHIHSWTKIITPSGLAAIAESGIPAVFTLHDYFYACPNGGFYDFQDRTLCNRKALSYDCITTNCDSRSYPIKIWRSVRQIMQNSVTKKRFGKLGFIFVSEYSSSVMKNYINDGVHCEIIANPEKYHSNDRIKCEDNQNYISVGRIEPEKGLDIAATAFNNLSLPWEIAGDGSDKNKIIDIYPDVKMSGWLSGDDLRNLYLRARALIFPSLIRETQGLSVIEALSFGIPVVVSSDIAAASYIEHEKNGLIFKRGDYNDLEKILKATTSNELISTMSLNAHSAHQAKRSGHYVDEILDFYARVAGG